MATSTLGSGTLVLAGTTSGTTTVTATAVAGTTTLTLPAATDTLVGRATTDTLTNKTLTGAAMNGTLGATTPSTGAFTTLSATGVTTVQAGTAAAPAITTTGDTNTGIFFPAADTIAFAEGGAEVARFDSSGNFGLGVTPSTWSTGKAQEFNTVGNAVWSTGANDLRLLANIYYNGGYKYATTASASMYQVSSGYHSWYNAASGTAGNTITFTQAMTLNASGNLGITETSPAAKLHISVASAAVDGTKGVRITNPAGTVAVFECGNGGDSFVGTTSGSDFNIRTNNITRATFDNAGNLLVGTTNTSESSGNGLKLLVGSTPGFKVVTPASTGSSASFMSYSSGAGAYRFYVTDAGVINATSTTITGISDERLKENIRDIDTGLDAVIALKPRRFDWKEGKGQDKKNAAGFIAQEFETVFPESVSTSMVGADGIEYKNINHETLIPTLVKAIQEQQAIIQSLTARITALESA